jgi:hypothetical protein
MTTAMTSAYCSSPHVNADPADDAGLAASAASASSPQFKRRSRGAPFAPPIILDWRVTSIIQRTHVKTYLNNCGIQHAQSNEVLEFNSSIPAWQRDSFPNVSLQITAGDPRMHRPTDPARRTH